MQEIPTGKADNDNRATESKTFKMKVVLVYGDLVEATRLIAGL